MQEESQRPISDAEFRYLEGHYKKEKMNKFRATVTELLEAYQMLYEENQLYGKYIYSTNQTDKLLKFKTDKGL